MQLTIYSLIIALGCHIWSVTYHTLVRYIRCAVAGTMYNTVAKTVAVCDRPVALGAVPTADLGLWLPPVPGGREGILDNSHKEPEVGVIKYTYVGVWRAKISNFIFVTILTLTQAMPLHFLHTAHVLQICLFHVNR